MRGSALWGRACIDMYAEKEDSRLEDVESFRISGRESGQHLCWAARLGLRTAMLTAVGDEAIGRFVCQVLKTEGIDTPIVV